MTREEQDKLRRALYNAKFTTDAYDQNPLVVIYFQDLLGIIADYDNNPQWIPVEEKKPQENQRVRAWSLENNEEYLCDYHDGIFEDFYGQFSDGKITHWMEIVPPRKEE